MITVDGMGAHVFFLMHAFPSSVSPPTHVVMYHPAHLSFFFFNKKRRQPLNKIQFKVSVKRTNPVMIKLTSPSCITGDTHLLFILNMADHCTRLLLSPKITITFKTSSYRCLARPRPGGSCSRRALCRTRQHPGTSSQGWWAPQSQPVPRRWGTLLISPERGIRRWCLRLLWQGVKSWQKHYNTMEDHTDNIVVHKSAKLYEICIIQELRKDVIVGWSGVRTKLSPLYCYTKPSVLTLHFAIHQQWLLV